MNVIETASRDEILKFKLLCKSNEFTDEQVDKMFTEFWLHDTDEVVELANILKEYRPNVYEKYNQLTAPKTKKKKS